VIERYLDSRATRFPATAKRRSSPAVGLTAWPTSALLFVSADGERITRGTLQYRVLRAFRRASIDADRARGAAVGRHPVKDHITLLGVAVDCLVGLLVLAALA
jgi:hypothetical protein